MPSLGGKYPSGSPDTDHDDVHKDYCDYVALGEGNENGNPSENPNILENNESTNDQETNYGCGNTYSNDPGDYLTARFIPQVPYQYQPTLIQFNEKEECTDYHFGLIRGYHNEMYEESKQSKYHCLCCSWSEQDIAERLVRRNRILACQIVGVICGVAFVFIGLTSLIVSFIVSSDGARKYLWDSFQISSAYIHVLAIVGLIVLTIGSAMVSLCLLVPLCIEQVHTQDVAGSWCTAGDVYVKNAEKNYNFSANQFLYFDAALYRKLFGKAVVKKIQPEIE